MQSHERRNRFAVSRHPARRAAGENQTVSKVPRGLLWLLAFAAMLIPVSRTSAATPDHRPNVVFFLADDMGYMDIGANNPGSFYETPNIDGLARKGCRFTQGYAACCVCSPTRASIMTGKYPVRTGITDFIPGMRSAKLLSAPNADHLALEEVTKG